LGLKEIEGFGIISSKAFSQILFARASKIMVIRHFNRFHFEHRNKVDERQP
jgi:hypothetical protein